MDCCGCYVIFDVRIDVVVVDLFDERGCVLGLFEINK